MNSALTETQQGIPAATVIAFRNGRAGDAPEILMTVRAREMVFAGGMAVFPVGRVEPADYELAQQIAGQIKPDEAAPWIAAIREPLEDTVLELVPNHPQNAV